MGGILQISRLKHDPTGNTRYMLAWGTVTREPKYEVTKKKGEPKVTFCIKTDRDTFVNILTLGDCSTTRIANSLSVRDMVAILGIWKQREYTNKAGEQKMWYELTADMIIPQESIEMAIDAAFNAQNQPTAPPTLPVSQVPVQQVQSMPQNVSPQEQPPTAPYDPTGGAYGNVEGLFDDPGYSENMDDPFA